MDNATHAFAGMLMADATATWIERRTGAPTDPRLRRTVVVLGILAAELPDADLAYSGPVVGLGKLGYLLHHRGHTHTLVFAVAAAMLLWWMTLVIRQRALGMMDKRERLPLLLLALAGTVSHVLLDFSNSYGVHPFWPIDNRWVYGDSVFIVEPWLWVAAIPPLLFGARARWSRVLLSVLLVIILIASWTVGELTHALAMVITVSATLWLFAQRGIPARHRVTAGIVAWCLVETVFAVSSSRARTRLREPLVPDERVADVVLTPAAGNPFCFDALVVSLSASEYRVRSATIAPWTSRRAALTSAPSACTVRATTGRFAGLPNAIALRPPRDAHDKSRDMTRGVTWGEQWSAPRAELAALASTRCQVAAALRFLRVPVWTRGADGDLTLSDARFGAGAGGFTDLRIMAGPCPLSTRAWIPPWTPPRTDVLEPGPMD